MDKTRIYKASNPSFPYETYVLVGEQAARDFVEELKPHDVVEADQDLIHELRMAEFLDKVEAKKWCRKSKISLENKKPGATSP